jgi:hypothetical protein
MVFIQVFSSIQLWLRFVRCAKAVRCWLRIHAKTINGYSYHPGGRGKSSHCVAVGALCLEPFYKNRGTSTKITVASSLIGTSNYRSALLAFNLTYDLE